MVLQKFFVDRCRANLHVLLVLEHHEANLQASTSSSARVRAGLRASLLILAHAQHPTIPSSTLRRSPAPGLFMKAQRLIVTFPKMFHLATIDVVDDWDADAKYQVACREFVSPETLLLSPQARARLLRASRYATGPCIYGKVGAPSNGIMPGAAWPLRRCLRTPSRAAPRCTTWPSRCAPPPGCHLQSPPKGFSAPPAAPPAFLVLPFLSFPR